MKNYYELFNLSTKATKEEIVYAYENATEKYRVYDGEDAEGKIRLLNYAYETLADDFARYEYDQQHGIQSVVDIEKIKAKQRQEQEKQRHEQEKRERQEQYYKTQKQFEDMRNRIDSERGEEEKLRMQRIEKDRERIAGTTDEERMLIEKRREERERAEIEFLRQQQEKRKKKITAFVVTVILISIAAYIIYSMGDGGESPVDGEGLFNFRNNIYMAVCGIKNLRFLYL